MVCEFTIRGKGYTREYNDYVGAGGPEAEQAFRQAFLAAAEEVADWDFPDLDRISVAWEERAHAKWKAQKWISERDYFGDPSADPFDAVFCVYQCGHEVEAARTRGRVHAFTFAVRAWQYFVAIGFSNNEVHREFMRLWPDVVREWATPPIDHFDWPPRPDEIFTRYQWRLILSKQAGERKVFASLSELESYLNNHYRRVLDAWFCFDRNRKQLGRMFLCDTPWNRTTIRVAACSSQRWILRSPSKP